MSNNVVFISGLGFKASVWKNIIPYFSNHKTHLVDLPEITKPDIDKIVYKLADQIPDNSIIIGWSLGGLLGLYLYHYFPTKCSKIALAASTPKFMEDQNWPGITKQQITNKMKDFIRIVGYPNKSLTIKNYLNEHTTDISAIYLDLITLLDAREIYQNISISILNMVGTLDAIVNIKQSRLLAKTYQIEGAGHIPFLTHEKIFITKLMEFIND